jgi:chromosome segregation protein
LRDSEKALADWQERWDEFANSHSDARQISNVEQTRIEQIESKLQSLIERRRKLSETDSGANIEELQQRFEIGAENEMRQRQSREGVDRQLAETAEKIGKLREQDQKLSRLVDERRATLQQIEGKYASLEAVQKAALGKGDDSVLSWLSNSGLADQPRVAQALDVEEGWENAAETVLGGYLQAVCVDDVASAIDAMGQFSSGTLTLVRSGIQASGSGLAANSLASKIRKAPSGIMAKLSDVRVAETLQAAMAVRDSLQSHESVITKDGIWLSHDWLRVSRDNDASAGILAREHEMRRVKIEMSEQKVRADSARKLLEDGRSQLNALEERRETLQRDATVMMNQYSDAKAGLDSAKFRLEQAIARRTAMAEESKEISIEILAAESGLRDSKSRLSQSGVKQEELEQQRATLEGQRGELRAELARVREQADEDRKHAQSVAIQFESRRSSKESAAQSLARMESQLTQFRTRERELVRQLEESEEPLANKQKELAVLLESRVAVESELGKARQLVEDVESKLRELDQGRMTLEQSVDDARTAVDEARLAVQEIRVRREGIVEQLAETHFTLEELIAELNAEANAPGWEEELEKVRRKMERLGPINLAAIDEFKEESDRKEYLDSQLADLNSALDTLQGAIRKIDRETRSRFKETYDKVDAGFKRLFPKLFGGGHAYMELTGDDLLTAGVTVMARPPGKRNSTINLLSGGEKALTAVALVFAIFELNPAPFCLLDEVDAPLDDNNVGRFCDIVKEMSDRVQFIFITHNKVTMELSRQLTGVTMHEPGVSRLVSVDLDEAVKMAAR